MASATGLKCEVDPSLTTALRNQKTSKYINVNSKYIKYILFLFNS